MTTKRLLICCVALVALAIGIQVDAQAGTSARPPVTLPSGPCDEDHILDIEIIDGVLYECSCDQRIFTENDCSWQEITSQADDPMRFRRVVKRAKARHRHIIVRVTPAPVRLVTPAPAVTVAAAPAPAAGKCADPYLADDAWSQQHGC